MSLRTWNAGGFKVFGFLGFSETELRKSGYEYYSTSPVSIVWRNVRDPKASAGNELSA